MEWMTCIKRAIDYMESELLTIQGPEEVAEHAYVSTMYLQKGFQIMTGYSLGEYMRNRKLYMAAMDLINSDEKIIDIAYKYGYETPESFTKAFSRFHESTPSEVRRDNHLVKVFLPLKVSIEIHGGCSMDFTVETNKEFKVIGFSKEFDAETAYKEIPLFWDEVFQKYAKNLMSGNAPETDVEKAFVENQIGSWGICFDNIGKPNKFRYIIGGTYQGGSVPECMEVTTIPEALLAKFKCVGPMPGALQSVNTKIWKEWLPGNAEYELGGEFDIEWYSLEGNTSDADYKSEIWIPVRKK